MLRRSNCRRTRRLIAHAFVSIGSGRGPTSDDSNRNKTPGVRSDMPAQLTKMSSLEVLRHCSRELDKKLHRLARATSLHPYVYGGCVARLANSATELQAAYAWST